VTTNARGEAEVLGGFEQDAMSEVDVPRSAQDGQLGDEAIADAIRQELREDATTTDLRIRVLVRKGVAHLRGHVAGPEDAENAEDVASRVPGVAEVVDELEVDAG
jgi:osmotically-inducible protein OsmY